MKILCCICGRGGSKEVPNKNIKMFLGKPLILYTIDQAKNSKIFDKIVLSSDSEKILKLGKKNKLDLLIKRPKNLSSGQIQKLSAIKHLFKESETFFKTRFDLIVDLDITAPLRTILDIKKSISIIKKKKFPSNLVNITPSRRNPYFNMVKIKNKKVKLIISKKKKIHARQIAPKVFDIDPAVYVWNRQGLLNCKNVLNRNTYYNIMPNYRSHDIDSLLDFKIVEYHHKLNRSKF